MKNLFVSTIIILIFGSLTFSLGYWYRMRTVEAEVITETKTVHKIIKVAKTCKEQKECNDSVIDIETDINRNEVKIKAKDLCKESTKSIFLTPPKRNTVVFNYGVFKKNLAINYIVDFDYFSLSCGIGYPVNAYVGAGIKF